MRWALLGLLLLGCAPTVLRDRTTYMAEVNFIDRMLREGSPAVRGFVVTRCACTGNVWRANGDGVTDAQCATYADWWMVYTARWTWHRDMMLYNARVTDVRPLAAPVIPPVTCDLPRSNP